MRKPIRTRNYIVLRSIPKDAEITIIEHCKNGMSIQDICRSVKVYRKPIEEFLLSQGLITKDKCKYF